MNDVGKQYVKYFNEQRTETDERVNSEIERNRKAFFHVHVVDGKGKPVTGATVKIKQVGHDFKFGCNNFLLDQLRTDEANVAYRAKYASLFNYSIVPFYWSDFELEDGKPRFGENPVSVYRRPAPEKVIKYCTENGIQMKGHPLFWHHFLPAWLPKDRDEAFVRIDKRLRELAKEYGNRIRDWDCVNESLESQYRDNKSLPENYPISVFYQAAKYFTCNRLFINEVTESSWDDTLMQLSAYYMQIENMLMKGAEIDCIGLQYHMFYSPDVLVQKAQQFYNPSVLFNCMDMYGKFGKPLHVSEITVPAYGGTDESKELQAMITEQLYRIWFSHASMEAIVWWNFVDGTAAYAPYGSLEGENYYCGGLLNNNMSEKPVYKVLDRLINHEWRTNATFENAQSDTLVHGFYGKYKIEVTTGGKTKEIDFHLSKLGERTIQIVM